MKLRPVRHVHRNAALKRMSGDVRAIRARACATEVPRSATAAEVGDSASQASASCEASTIDHFRTQKPWRFHLQHLVTKKQLLQSPAQSEPRKCSRVSMVWIRS